MSFRVVFQSEKPVSPKKLRTFVRKFKQQSFYIREAEVFERADEQDAEHRNVRFQYLVAVELLPQAQDAKLERALCRMLMAMGMERGLTPVDVSGIPQEQEAEPQLSEPCDVKIYLATEENDRNVAVDSLVRQACEEGRDYLQGANLATYPFSDEQGNCYEITLTIIGGFSQQELSRIIYAFYFRLLGLGNKAGLEPVPKEIIKQWFGKAER